jgi:hypothetical protein
MNLDDGNNPLNIGRRGDATNYFTGSMSELRISKGTSRWTSNFTPPAEPYTTTSGIDSYTKLLLHFDGDQSSSDHSATFNGDINMNASTVKFEGSYYFDGTDDYISIADSDDWYFGAGNFTIDFWMRWSVNNSLDVPFSQVADTNNRILLYYDGTAGTPYFRFYGNSGGTGVVDYILYFTPTVDTWYHFMLIRDGASLFFYINGQPQIWDTINTQIGTTTLPNYGAPFEIGRQNLGGAYYYFNGYIDEFRISKGIARYTGNFTPPSVPYTTASGIDSYTKLLLHCEGDQSGTGHLFKWWGDPQLKADSGKFDGCLYFDGAGDYGMVEDSGDLWKLTATQSWTVDFWLTSLGAQASFGNVLSRSEGGGSWTGWFITFGNADDKLGLRRVLDGSTAVETPSDVPLNEWHHYAFVHDDDADKLYLFVDGVLKDEDTASTAINWTNTGGTHGLYVGVQEGNGARIINAYLSDIRISKGLARWTENFIPPYRKLPFDVESNNKKIAVTESDGTTQCYVEIERWDVENNKAELWVKVPTVSSGTDTNLYLYYDNMKPDNDTYVGDTTSAAAQNVWDNNYKLVYHLSQRPEWNDDDCILDSTSYVNHGTPAGTLTSADFINAKIGKGLDLDGNNDHIDVGADSTLESSDFTWEAIIKPGNDAGHIIDKSTDDSNRRQFYYSKTGNNFGIGLVATWWAPSHTLSMTNYHHVVFRHDNGTEWDIFVNGVGVINQPYAGGISNNSVTDLYVGARANDTGYFLSAFDEIRVSNIVRPDSWIETTYYSNFDNLITFGSPQALSGFISYVEGQCTDRYGVPMSTACDVVVLDDDTYEVLGYGLSVSGTGRFSVEVTGTAAGSDVLVTYSYRGNYGSVSDLAGAEFMTTVSGGGS